MLPKSIKGKMFMVLTFVNVGIASYFASKIFYEQALISGVTSLLCLTVWITEKLSDNKQE